MATSHLSIPELFKIVRHSFRESEFDEVEQILIEREKRIKIEMQDLQRDLDSTKKVARLLECSQGLAELEKLKIEEKLARLSEEHRVSCDRAKRAEERHETLSKEFSEMISENNTLILELNGKIKDLQDKNMENEQLVVNYKEESKSLETKIVNLGREKMESDNWVKNLGSRVMILETELANMLNVKVEDLASLVNVGTCNSTPLVAKGSHDSVTRRPSKAPVSSCPATEVIEICDSDDETKPTDMSINLSSRQNKRKRRLEKEPRWYSSSESG